MIRRWRARRPDPHQLLVQDIDRVRQYMRAVILDARRLDVPVPSPVVISAAAWGEWLDNLTTPIEEE